MSPNVPELTTLFSLKTTCAEISRWRSRASSSGGTNRNCCSSVGDSASLSEETEFVSIPTSRGVARGRLDDICGGCMADCVCVRFFGLS